MAGEVVRRLGHLFYLVDRNATTYERMDQVPNYIKETTPTFLALVVVEWAVVSVTNTPLRIRANDVITSTLHGMVYSVAGALIRGLLLLGYEEVFTWRLVELDWRSPWVWWGAALGIDMLYYWFHRAAHEINILWASHQVHHSSEDYNLTTAIRQSVVQRYFSFVFYLPLALLGIPPALALTHLELNLLYQFWIHTELVDHLGPLEWVLNTPSHHRVHHGADKYCLDKNYGGVLIVWDRLFGTFAAERRDHRITYGLVDQPQTLNVLYLQVFYFIKVISKARSMGSWSDFFRAIFYGPGWFPGTPRLGDPDTFPEPRGRAKYDPRLPPWLEAYVMLHFLVVVASSQMFVARIVTLAWLNVVTWCAFIVASVWAVGGLYDGWRWAPLLEVLRCVVFLLSSAPPASTRDVLLFVYFGASCLVWVAYWVLGRKAGKKE